MSGASRRLLCRRRLGALLRDGNGARPTPLILMNSPQLVLGPPVRDGKPYAEIAHTAQIGRRLRRHRPGAGRSGLCRAGNPRAGSRQGFLLIEQSRLGGLPRRRTASRLPSAMPRRPNSWPQYMRRNWPDRSRPRPASLHQVPPFDRDAMMIEVDLLVDWYLPYATGKSADDDAFAPRFAPPGTSSLAGSTMRSQHSCCATSIRPTSSGATTQGHDRLGIIDFQDALIGPAAYDVASLAMDARVTCRPRSRRRRSPPMSRRARRRRIRRGAILAPPMPSWRRSATPRSSASSCASTGATASRPI